MRTAHLSSLVVVLAACSEPAASRVVIDVSALRAAAALSFTPIDRLEILIEADDLPPMRVAVDAGDDTFEASVDSGRARHFTLEAKRSLEDGSELPVYFGETVMDLPPGDVEVIINAYPVGVLDLSVVGADGLPSASELDLLITTSGAIPGLHDAQLTVTTVGAAWRQVLRPGAVSITASTPLSGGVALTLPHGELVSATLFPLSVSDKCAANAASAVRAASPVCRSVSVQVLSATGPGTVVELRDAAGAVLDSVTVDPVAGAATFAAGVADGESYSLAVSGNPAGQECVVQGESLAVITGDVTRTVLCAEARYQVTLDVRGLMGTGLVVILAAGSTYEELTVDSDGLHPFVAMLPPAAILSLYIEAGQPTVGACTVTAAPRMISSDLTVPVLCTGNVAPYYASAPNWTDFARAGLGRGAPACQKGTDERQACEHGGERRAVEVRDLSSCAGVTATDDLGAFEWVCEDPNVGAPGVLVTSKQLLPARGLSHLIGGGAFLSNRVAITEGGLTRFSLAEAWWTNRVLAVSDPVSAPTPAPYDVWVVFAPTGPFAAPVNNFSLVTDVEVQILASISNPAFDAAGHDNVWVEGALLESLGYVAAVDMGMGSFSTVSNANVSGGAPCVTAAGADVVLRAVRAVNCYANGIELTGARALAEDVTVETTSGYGIYANAPRGTLRRVGVARSGAEGIVVEAGPFLIEDTVSSHNGLGGLKLSGSGLANVTLRRLQLGNNGGAGLDVALAANTRASQILAVANNGPGVRLGDSSGGVFSDLTLVSQGGANLDLLSQARFNTFIRVAALAAFTGVSIQEGATGNRFIDVAALNNGTGVSVQGTASEFHGLLLVGLPANDCSVNVDTGLVAGTCTVDGTEGSSTYPGGSASTAQLLINRDASSAFLGVASDAVNQSAFDGAGLIGADPADWLRFENAYRAFLRHDVSYTWPNIMLAGPAIAQALCELRDWRATSGGVLSQVLPSVPTTAALRVHTWSTASAPASQTDCDAAAPGSTFSGGACLSSYVDRARELAGGAGDGDGLCEAAEVCVEARNLGAYQGEGLPAAPRTVNVGGASVQLLTYPVQVAP